MYDILSLVLPLFGLIFLGFFVARLTRQPLEALGWMNTFILYLAMPALFIQLLSRTPIEQLSEIGYIFGSLLTTLAIFAAMFSWSMMRRAGAEQSTIKALSASYGNVGYMGPGVALVVLGPEAAAPIALLLCFENVMHFAITPLIIGISRSEGAGIGSIARDVAAKIVFNPLIIGVAIGFLIAWLDTPLPLALETLLSYLAQAAAPCALFAMGVSLALRPLTRIPSEMVGIVALKLLIHPALCYVVLSWVGNYSPTWMFAAVLLASLPTATNVFVLAQHYGVWVQRASASILITTSISVVTVTALVAAIKSGVLPPDLFP